ncbi:hypothetical protein [Hahella ganghwensis]|uniref:hypothetical protein n=1 Tax=Hahella ganghwensis TaxID=286420 RepID=UPI0003763720|nr:hypothetical protein [Hahella ganghwensis]
MSELRVLRQKIDLLVQEAQWQQIAALDEIVRDVISQAVQSVTDDNRDEIREDLNNLQQSYATALASMQRKQGESASELASMQRSYKAAKSYLDSSKF